MKSRSPWLDTAFSPQWGTAGYTYDTMGNVLTKSFSDWNGIVGNARTVTNLYDDASNRVASSTDSHNISYGFGYDTRGNVTQTGGLKFTYDMADQPISMEPLNGIGKAPNTSKVITGSYVYDGNFKRVKSTVNGITRYNVYDISGKLIHVEEIDEDGVSSQTDYLNAAGMTLARIKENVFTYMHPDHLGSPTAGTDGDGNIAFTERYTPFGEALLNPAANDNQSGFMGHIKDTSTGLNYMQARYYDPNIGRFLSVDPVSFIGSGYNPAYFNRYAYSGNDPINNVDPDGEFFQVAGFVLGVVSNVAIQTMVEGKPLGEVNVVEALTSGAVGATGLGAASQVVKALKAVKGAKQVGKNLKKAQRHAQSRSRRGKDTFNADKKVNSLQKEIRGDIKEAAGAVTKAVGAGVGKKVIDETVPEVTVNDVGQAIQSAAKAASESFDKVLENEVNR